MKYSLTLLSILALKILLISFTAQAEITETKKVKRFQVINENICLNYSFLTSKICNFKYLKFSLLGNFVCFKKHDQNSLIDTVKSTDTVKVTYKNLSYKLNYEVLHIREEIKNEAEDETEDKREVILRIMNKLKDSTVQVIHYNPEFLYSSTFSSSANSRSFITGYNLNKVAGDSDYGDLIIVDLNFDGKEDFAIKLNSGGNAGPFYRYYVYQDKAGFQYDEFLSSIGLFPGKIDKTNKTINFYQRKDVSTYIEKIYRYNIELKKWGLLKSIVHRY